MNELSTDSIIEVIGGIARTAGDFAKRHRGELFLDAQCQEMILASILSRWPHTKFYLSAEENSPSYGKFSFGRPEEGSYRWIIDPIDGTGNFESFHSHDYAVSIALEHGSNILAGAVYFPEKDELFTCINGDGVKKNGMRMAAVTDSAFSLDDYVMISQTAYNVNGLFPKKLLLRCACESILSIADRRRKCYIFSRTNVWDIGASLLMLKELGGAVKDIHGNDLTTHNKLTSIESDLFVACCGIRYFGSFVDYYCKAMEVRNDSRV